MSDHPGLFDATGYQQPAEPQVSPDRRRTRRQHQAAANGVHPLVLALPGSGIRVHPDAAALGLTCGTCWYRRTISTGSARDWPKCTYGTENDTDQRRSGPPPRASRGGGTDVRRWWPACADYSPGDGAVSADAARYIPEAVSLP